MKIGKRSVQIFKIKNRRGYAAICERNLTEGKTIQQVIERMTKAIRRTSRKAK